MKNNDISMLPCAYFYITRLVDILSWLTEPSIKLVNVYGKKVFGNALRYAVLDFYMRY